MSKTLRYRLFKVGAMPPVIRDRVSREQVLFFDEGVPVTIRRSGTAPGFRGSATGKFSGAFAISGRHIVATVSKTTMVDADFDAQYAGEKPLPSRFKKTVYTCTWMLASIQNARAKSSCTSKRS